MKDCTFPRCGCSEREQCRPTPAPSVQPVRAWAVVDKDGIIDSGFIWSEERQAEYYCSTWNRLIPMDAPHRVIRVEIREVNDE